MARAKREPFGPWSLTQVAAEAGITHRTARTLVANHVLNPHRLGYKDVLIARVAAALLDAPRPAGLNRVEAATATADRDAAALQHAHTVIDTPSPTNDTFLAIYPAEANLLEGSIDAMGALAAMRDQPLLLLPIGRWAAALRTAVLTPAEAS